MGQKGGALKIQLRPNSFLCTIIVFLTFSVDIKAEITEGEKKAATENLSGSLNQLFIWNATKDPSLDPYASHRTGIHVPSLTESQRCGPNGPVLLMDSNLVEFLTTTNRERIPERVVHAKGAGAYGYFEVTDDISYYTKLAPFSKIGKKTPLLVRFSLSKGEMGSADTARDNRGFCIKFYTEKGNWNLAGFNIPIVHSRDGLSYHSLAHAMKRNPATHLHDPNAAFDFLSSKPEGILNTLMTFSDIGIPNGYRFMDGFGIHTYELINHANQVYYCRFHWFHDQKGKSYLNQTEATILAGTQPDYAIQDLYDAIAANDNPTWTLFVQILTVEQVQNYKFNVFDVTKILPVKDFPMQKVGKLILNRNPKNFFSEVEQAAFDPGDLIPGIQISPLDALLQVRSFAYRDAQRYRLGASFSNLKINRPQNLEQGKVYAYERDGPCNTENYGDGPNYYPNSFGGPGVDPEAARVNTLGLITRTDTGDEDNFSQAREYLKEMPLDEFKRLVLNLSLALAQTNEIIVEKILAVYAEMDAKFVLTLRAALPQAKAALLALGIKVK